MTAPASLVSFESAQTWSSTTRWPNGSNAPSTGEARIVALDIPDRDAILRVLEDCPEELAELRAMLLQEHVWRRREWL